MPTHNDSQHGSRLFDVFLCHCSQDKPAVRTVSTALWDNDIVPWLDEDELRPGLPFQDSIESQIGTIPSAAVFLGPNGRGPWQQQELNALIAQFVRRRCPVIPVILPGCSSNLPEIPPFLAAMTWVDFRVSTPDPVQQLIWGITGKRPSKRKPHSENDHVDRIVGALNPYERDVLGSILEVVEGGREYVLPETFIRGGELHAALRKLRLLRVVRPEGLDGTPWSPGCRVEILIARGARSYFLAVLSPTAPQRRSQ